LGDFGEAAEDRCGQGAVAECDASPDDDATHLDCPTAEQEQPRLPDLAGLPRFQRAARLYATLSFS
jgi:hypothetical protein